MEKGEGYFEMVIGETVEIEDGHTIVVTTVDPGRRAHRLYVRENDQGLLVNHIVSVFNADIMVFGNRIHLQEPDLKSILAGSDELKGR